MPTTVRRCASPDCRLEDIFLYLNSLTKLPQRRYPRSNAIGSHGIGYRHHDGEPHQRRLFSDGGRHRLFKTYRGSHRDRTQGRGRKIVKSLRTDANGYAMLNSLNDYGYYYFQAIVGNDHSRSLSTWLNYASTEGSRHLKATVFTDRGVYRPGETVNFAVAAYVSGMRFLETAKRNR